MVVEQPLPRPRSVLPAVNLSHDLMALIVRLTTLHVLQLCQHVFSSLIYLTMISRTVLIGIALSRGVPIGTSAV